MIKLLLGDCNENKKVRAGDGSLEGFLNIDPMDDHDEK